MRSSEKMCGKQRSENAELGTENRKTHDVKPTTLDTEQRTDRLLGPIFLFRSSVSCSDLISTQKHVF